MVAGVSHLRVLPTSAADQHTLRPGALEAAVAADMEAGLLPCFVCGTIGTTGSCAVDPIPALAAVAHERGLWCADGACRAEHTGRRPRVCVPATAASAQAPSAPCPRLGCRMHVDAAWAGTFAILPEMQHFFAGLDAVDSLDTNPHKGAGPVVPLCLAACLLLPHRQQRGRVLCLALRARGPRPPLSTLAAATPPCATQAC